MLRVILPLMSISLHSRSQSLGWGWWALQPFLSISLLPIWALQTSTILCMDKNLVLLNREGLKIIFLGTCLFQLEFSLFLLSVNKSWHKRIDEYLLQSPTVSQFYKLEIWSSRLNLPSTASWFLFPSLQRDVWSCISIVWATLAREDLKAELASSLEKVTQPSYNWLQQ